MTTDTDRALVPLERAELVEIAGADALAFAHAQFASDVRALESSSWQWSAWLTAQGRVHAMFALLRIEPDRLLMWLPLGDAAAVRDALARFVFRAKVSLAVRDGWALCRLDGQSASAASSARGVAARLGGVAFAQPGGEPRHAWLGPAPSTPPDAAALDAWRRADIAAGLPWISAATRDEFVPQALDLERLDAIAFEKGCYPGQEIVARLHFRGGNKRRLRKLALSGDRRPEPGLAIRRAGGVVGTLLYGAAVEARRYETLAVMIDDDSDAASTSVEGHSIEAIYNSF
jgi:folate-binding protein YgfZ